MNMRWDAIPSIFGYRTKQGEAVFRDRSGGVIHTERALATLCMLASAALSLLLIAGILRRFFILFDLAQFLLWSGLTALASWLVGALLGLLFGLPSVREVRLSDGVSGAQQAGGALTATGYQESTNLDQGADWVTKILIGLPLTQYTFWEAAFQRAFTYSSRLMLGHADAGPAPATIIAVAFAANGFLIVYIAMRRYFIAEMVAGRSDAQGQIDALIESKKKAGLLQQTSVTTLPNQQANDARSIAETAVRLAPSESVDSAKAIAKQTSDFPDDPWRGKFGGDSVAGGCRLSASVTPLDKLDQFFTIRLLLTADRPESRSGQTATIYLHPTFGPDPKKVAFGPDGTATLEVIAYGAFTVGVLLEDGERLELNLATLPDAPEAFRQR